MKKLAGIFIFFVFILLSCEESKSKIKLICDIDESKVYIDGEPKAVCYANSTLEINVSVGSHKIEVKKPIDENTLYYYRKTIQLHKGSVITIKIESKKAYSEAYYWNKAKRTNKLEDYIEYFNKYPNGKYAEEVKERLKKVGYPIKIWDKTYGGSHNDEATSIIETKDGYYLIAGSTSSYGKDNYDALVFEIDKDGNKIWDKTYGGSHNDEATSIIETKDGYYLIAGSTSSYGKDNAWVIKIDKDGNKIWDKTFDIKDIDEATSIIETEDGYLIAGYTMPYRGSDYDAWIIKLDKNGNKIWEKIFGGSGIEVAHSIIKTEDDFLIVGFINSYNDTWDDAWVVKIDKNGNKIWEKTFGGSDRDEATSIIETEDGYLIAGFTKSYGNGSYDAWVVKIDKNGNKIWEKTFGGSDRDEATSIIETEDGYLIAGFTKSYGNGSYDAWIIKLEPIK